MISTAVARGLAAALAIYREARRSALEAGRRHRLLVQLGSRACGSARWEREAAVVLALETRSRWQRIARCLESA
jgi:hypothetical protein